MSFSVLQTIEEVRLLLAHRLRLAQCTLVVSCHTLEPILYGNPSQFGQVLTNLIVNAIDAYQETDRKGGEIHVDIRDQREALELRVADLGCGIPSEHLDHIFNELFSTKPLGIGTGLGLSIVQEIVTNSFGGTIHVESIVDKGSEFCLRLPRNAEFRSA